MLKTKLTEYLEMDDMLKTNIFPRLKNNKMVLAAIIITSYIKTKSKFLNYKRSFS